MDDFTKCPVTAELRDQIYRCLPQFVFYKKSGRKAECYCTSCHRWYDDGCSAFRTFQSIDNIKHNAYGICTNCGEAVQFKAMGRGLKSYYHRQNFAVFSCVDDTVYIRCFLAGQYFIDDRFEPDYDLSEVTRYSLRAGKAVQYKFRWERGWEAKTTKPREPVFQMSRGFGYIPDNSYTLLNEHCLTKSFLRYHVAGLPATIHDNFITYLCCCAVHPNIEYLVKGGFWELAMAYVERKAGVHISWKSNDLLKMLRLNRTELKFLKGGSALKYRGYTDFRRKIYKGRSAEDTILYYELFCQSTEHLELIHSKTGLPFKQIMDYIRKQAKAEHTSIYLTCLDYRDYIRECEQLEYDMTDPAVIAPRRLYDAHRRTSGMSRTDEEHYAALVELAGELLPYIHAVIVDPSAASFITCIYRHGGFRVWKADNRVIDGIRDTAALLSLGYIHICEGCTDIIREFGLYRWDDKHTDKDTVLKINDHAMDDMRYFVRGAMYQTLNDLRLSEEVKK